MFNLLCGNRVRNSLSFAKQFAIWMDYFKCDWWRASRNPILLFHWTLHKVHIITLKCFEHFVRLPGSPIDDHVISNAKRNGITGELMLHMVIIVSILNYMPIKVLHVFIFIFLWERELLHRVEVTGFWLRMASINLKWSRTQSKVNSLLRYYAL